MTRDTTPPKTSTLIVISLGAIAGVFLFREITELWAPLAMGVIGILCLAGCFELVISDETGPGRGFLLGLLTIPVGAGFIGGIFGTLLVLTSAEFPVPSSPQISVAILRILGGLSIVIGCTIALFGFVLGRRNTLDEPSLRTYTKIAFVTASVPVTCGLLLFVRVAVFESRAGAAGSPFGRAFDQSIQVVFSPTTTHLHLGSFLFVLTVAGVSALLFVRQVPLADFFVGDGTRSAYHSISRAKRGLQLFVSATALLMIPGLVLEAVIPPRRIESTLGTGLYAAIQAITTAGILRLLLVGIVVATVGWLVVNSVLKQWSQRSEPDGSQWFGPFVAGVLLTLTAGGTAGQALDRMLTETTAQLPESLALELQNRILPIVSIYGEVAVVVLLAGVLVALAGWIGLTSWLAVYFGYLTDDGAGFSIASSGLFLAAIGAVIEGSPTWLVLGVIVVSLAVWDIGTFGTQLGQEMGEGQTREVELVHASATLVVGLAAGLAALGLLSAAPRTVDPSPAATLALACLGGGFVAFSLALRESLLG